jgi:hypothetical protein
VTLRRRLRAVEERQRSRAEDRREPPTWAELYAKAWASATPEEAAEAERLVAEHDARRGGPPPEGQRRRYDPAEDAALYALWEAMLERVEPFWAAEFRRFRDLPTIALERLEREWTAAGRKWSTSQSDPEYWRVAQAAWSRWHAVRHRGSTVVTDAEKAARIVAAVRQEGITQEEVIALVG